MSSKKSYVKHHVERNPQTLDFLVEVDGKEIGAKNLKEGDEWKAVPGKKIRNCRITDAMAEELNELSLKNGYVYVPATEEPSKEEVEETTDESKDEEIDETAPLWEKINDFKDKGLIDELPHPKTGVKKLTALIDKVEKGE